MAITNYSIFQAQRYIVVWFVEAFSLSENKIIDLNVKKKPPAVAAILILFATQKN